MNILTSPLKLDCCTQQDLLDYLQNSWELEATLLNSIIDEETFYLNPDPLRNCLIFYLGHSAVFYINKLKRVGLLTQSINDYYESLFEIGVDPETPEELEQAVQNISWPKVEKVWQYREQAKAEIINLIEKITISLPITQDSPLWALLMAIEHSNIHFETSSMLIRQLPTTKLKRPNSWNYAVSQGNPPKNEMIEVSGGKVTVGKSPESLTYGWDSDYGNLSLTVNPFVASKYLITNQEFLEFVVDDGYKNSQYWDKESWQWKQEYEVQHPNFWIPINNSYRYRTIFEEIDLPLDFPVEVNHYEAMAYCRWRGQGIRLLTEAEWNLARGRDLDAAKNYYYYSLNSEQYNLNLKYCSPSPVGIADNSNNKFGFCDLRGNVWEWLGDTFNSLPGFKPHYLYEDYSQPFFDHNHYLMVGGSWASMGAYAAAVCRNWFRPYFYQHVGFRIAKDINSN